MEIALWIFTMTVWLLNHLVTQICDSLTRHLSGAYLNGEHLEYAAMSRGYIHLNGAVFWLKYISGIVVPEVSILFQNVIFQIKLNKMKLKKSSLAFRLLLR